MLSSLGSLINIFALTFISPFASAANGPPAPLPMDANYIELTASQIYGASFSTDPDQHGQVAAIQQSQQANLEAFIINKAPCVESDGILTYRLMIRNVGLQNAINITIQDRFVADFDTQVVNPIRPPADDDIVRSGGFITIIWRETTLAPQGFLEYTFSIDNPVDSSNHLTVTYFSADGSGPYTALSDHAIPGECTSGGIPTEPRPSGQPAIVCDPAETNCTQVLPSLGVRFQKAQDLGNQPRICADQRYRGSAECVENYPALGVRFREAIADITPGECRVVADEIVISPDFHDAFIRRADPSAPFMFPLYQSGLDFKQLVFENILLDIEHLNLVRDALTPIYIKHWQKQIPFIEGVLDGSISTDTVRAKIFPINTWDQEWRDEVRQAQVALKSDYLNKQTIKAEKFDPVAQQAIEHAKESIALACSIDSDGGISGILPSVKVNYEGSLDQRTAAYDQTQAIYADSNNDIFAGFTANEWRDQLLAALAAFDQGNPQLLKDYLADPVGTSVADGDAKFIEDTYGKHAEDDEATDNVIRLQYWEIALDPPKSVATNCEKEKVFSPAVETTWCESDGYPEYLTEETLAVREGRENRLPPDTSVLNGYDTSINSSLVLGSSCSGRPGDPWWTLDCECHCGAFFPVVEGQIALCIPEHYAVPVVGGFDADPLIRHDIFVTSREECLQDTGHGDPFL